MSKLMHNFRAYIFAFCFFMSVAYTALNKLLAFLYACIMFAVLLTHSEFQVVSIGITVSRLVSQAKF